MNFNESQKRVICNTEGPLLVSAGPGSGKTATMIERIVYMIEINMINPEKILVITFSRAAANEMRERFYNRIKKKEYKVKFGTFHSVFLGMIKLYYKEKFKISIVTKEEKEGFIVEFLNQLGFDIILRDFIDEFLLDITLYKNSLIRIDDFIPGSCDLVLFSKLFTKYESRLNELNMIDFDDIILIMNNLLDNSTEFKRFWQCKYTYVLIDEFQDINNLQFSCIKKLFEKTNNIFAVGDEDQSIYGFRGSSPGIMLDFKNQFPDSEVIKLSINYRSVKNIVSESRKLISNNKQRYNKELVSYQSIANKTHILKCEDSKDQLNTIIKTFHDVNYESSAIIVRTNLERRFFDNNINLKNCRVITAHESKGLEFDLVYIPNAEDGLFPFKSENKFCDIEEERRLFYVAMTRAKRYLFISYRKYSPQRKLRPSPFIKEL